MPLPSPTFPTQGHTLSTRLRVWCCLLALLCGPAWAIGQRQVLVLYTLGGDNASVWQTLLHQGLTAELAKQAPGLTLGMYDERLDAVRLGDQPAMAAMEPYLRAKYAGVKFDIIITENYLAARFLSQHPTLFPGAARVYLNHGRPGWEPTDGIGYNIATDFQHAVGVIPLVAPGVNRVVVVGDSTERVQEWIGQVRSVAAGYQGRLVFEYWDDLVYDELYRRAGALRPGTAIFLLAGHHDSSGANARPVDVARQLAGVARVPIFTHLESQVVPGVVGGYVIRAERIGRAIAAILLQQPPDVASVPGYVFDYPSALRFHLTNLPPHADWRNRPDNVWELYRWQILAILSLIVLEGVLISALVVALRGRRQSMTALHDERNQLEERVQRRTLQLQAANNKLELLATTDPLTGIGNRRRMTEQISKELERSRRFRHPLALLMVDIDNFKDVNDRHGHDAGDRAIVAVARTLAGGVRSIDMVSRFGGEEFVLLMPESDLEVAACAAERLRAEVSTLQVTGDQGETLAISVSIGVAAADPGGVPDSASSLLIRADKALYQAKHAGRDRVVLA